MGIPILVAGQVTGIDSFAIGQMVGRQLPFLTIIVLFWIMAIMDGWRGIKETWPAVHGCRRLVRHRAVSSALTSLARNCRTSSPLWCHWFA
ncbi:L-lactate permease [Raoultella planticola]|uniref:L-lactate permease n=1 Tax=Raoultella planticola TaxID=575 RepID=A0A485BB30_RAOPL|nr:L-lactate permease [Raoultella planticola]